MNIEVRLSPDEVRTAARIGAEQQIAHLMHQDRGRYGAGLEQTWRAQITGVIGEMAFAKHLGVYYDPGDPGQPGRRGDVAGFEVRATVYTSNAHLPLHPADHDDRWFFLVTGQPPVVTIRGAILGRDGKQKQWYTDKFEKGRPAYWVPVGVLQDYYDPDLRELMSRPARCEVCGEDRQGRVQRYADAPVYMVLCREHRNVRWHQVRTGLETHQ